MLTDELTSLKTRRIRKIFTVFLLGIVIPAAFLSFWGFRSFQYEQILLQKQTEERFAATGDLVERKVGEQFAALTGALSAFALDENVQRRDVPKVIPTLFSVKTLGGFPVSRLYLFNERDQMIAPWWSVVRAPAGQPLAQELDWGSLKEDEKKAEQYEFENKDMPRAIQAYKALEPEVTSPLLQATLLKNVAGCYRKSNQDRLAEAAYLKLIDTYDQVIDFSGYPMGVLSLQGLGSLYSANKSWGQFLDVELTLYEGVVFGRWSLTSEEKMDLVGSLTASIHQRIAASRDLSAGYRARWVKIQAVQVQMQQAEPLARTFVTRDWPGLLARLRTRGWLEQGGILRISTPENKEDLAVVVPVLSRGNVHRSGYLVALLSAQPLWTSVERSMLELAHPSGLRVESDLLEPTRTPSLTGLLLENASVDRYVLSIDPPLHLRLLDSNPTNSEQFFWRRRFIYCGMITLSFVVIVVGLTTMAQAMKRETEVANLKADFVANVSHELRTPLTAISHIGERLSLGRIRSEAERDQFYLLLGQETKRLRTMIEDILDFSKMLAGQMFYRRERMDLVAAFREAREQFKGKAAAQGFEIAFEMPTAEVFVMGDRRAIVVAILNILDNAIKYSGESRTVRARLYTRARQALVEVQDFGIGIEAIEYPRIFEKFYRVDQTAVSGSERGVGLGLSMVKHIMDGHHGRVQVSSQPGKGSLFTLEFPLSEGE